MIVSKKNILSLSSGDARKFFLKGDSYCTINLPHYFKFEPILNLLRKKIKTKNIKDIINGNKLNNLKSVNNVNYNFISNKDGMLSWRQLQIINPAVYLVLCNLITDNDNWEYIKNRFKKFQKYSKFIEATGIPVVDIRNKKHDATQINEWWSRNEQKAIELSLEFEYVSHTDISTFYDSIYTHSIVWALHRKDNTKKLKFNIKTKQKLNKLGDEIDTIFQSMSYGETHGIPQGNIISDFIAEILLGYLDVCVFYSLRKKHLDYKILRYRDDYRIFTHTPVDAELILSEISNTLQTIGLRLNAKKTLISNDVISTSVKKDKLDNLLNINFNDNYIPKSLLYIYRISLIHSNSGTIKKYLKLLYDVVINKKDKIINDDTVIISLLINIALKNPISYPSIAAIISAIIEKKDESYKKLLAEKILKRFERIPYISWLEVWLQRIFINSPSISKIIAQTPICNCVLDNNMRIWNMDWLSKSYKDLISKINIVDRSILEKTENIIRPFEFDVFTDYELYY